MEIIKISKKGFCFIAGLVQTFAGEAPSYWGMFSIFEILYG